MTGVGECNSSFHSIEASHLVNCKSRQQKGIIPNRPDICLDLAPTSKPRVHCLSLPDTVLILRSPIQLPVSMLL